MIINRSSQTILCCVETIPNKIKFFCSIVYASNNGTERRRLWKELEDHKRFTRQHPWVLMGDFNVTLNIDEHSTGMSYRSMDMQEFFEAVNKLEVEDICSSGFHYTWTKSLKNPNCLTLKKLDRIMVNDEFMRQYQRANGVFHPYGISDHSLAELILHDGFSTKNKAFRFSNFVAGKDNFIDVVKSGWNIDVQGCHMYRLVKKLKNLKKPLKKLSWCQGNVHERTNNLKNELLKNQAIMEKNPFDSDARVNAAKALNDYIEASKDDLSLLYQKAKVQWLREGDKNTTYFHSMIKSRRNKSRVERIKDEDGNVHEGNNVAEQFVRHFKKFLGEYKEVVALDDEIFSNKINSEDAAIMTSEITSDEIKEAIFDIDSNKASGRGPDGFSSDFFKKAWEIVGNDVCMAVKEFFRSGKILGEINATLITLIPKINTPNKVSDFRPIACCNVIYECISKILTNIIKMGLSKIVNINQSAFIPGRHIQDNILLAQELLRGYNRKNGPKRCAMQIDIQKAYDTVSWSFLKDTLLHFGFPDRMVNWIMACITSSAFSIYMNGETHGYFRGGRGLRQGDPISPYLFTLVMEYCVKEIKALWSPDKVEERINCWRNKTLSYAGRVQLHASVLSSMQIYWASVYLIPSTVVKDLDKMFKRFLWNAGDSAQGKARVAWKSACRPKEQGGLGIKPLKQWNVVLLIKHFWKIIENKESLWAKWVNTVRLKDKSIWEIEMDKSDSSGWKTMLTIRETVKDHVWYNIGNGKNTSVFYDKWCENGPLSAFLNKQKSHLYPLLRSIRTPSLQDKEDWVQWINYDNQKTCLHLMACYPRQAIDDLKCALCKRCADSHDHLFFKCEFALKKEIKEYSERKASRTEEIVCKIIIEQVRNKLLSLKIKKSSNVIKEAKKWNLQWTDMSLIAI
ncbi:RNA-directed DNA polymerase, eukaryota, reverse transcriptase zinc-binding domain protein [Tanacetum coccineum]